MFLFIAAFDTWIMTCQDYAAQLESEGQYHKAATYLLAAHKVYDALELFKRHRLFKSVQFIAPLTYHIYASSRQMGNTFLSFHGLDSLVYHEIFAKV